MPTLLGTVVSPQSWPLSIQTIFLITALLAFSGLLARPSIPATAPKFVKGWPLVGSIEWFIKRRDFQYEAKQKSKNGLFSFYFGSFPIVAVSGNKGRAVFFGSRGLSFEQGIQDLAAPGPQGEWFIGGIGAYFIATMKRFAINKERCDVALPYLINDVHAHLTTYTSRSSNIISPFDDMWNLIYQLTHRTLGCHDIADDPKLLAKTLPLAQALSKSTTMEVLFPWLPVPNRIRKLWASGRLAWILCGLAKKRRRSGKQGDDIMQTLINHDHENLRIAAFIAGAIFAGMVNTGHNAGWVICYLAENPYWYSETQKQVDEALSKHRKSETETPVDIFHRLTLEQWETEFSLIDLGLRDSIRLGLAGSLLRKNISGQDIKIGNTGEVIPKGYYVTYLLDDVHFNEDIYTDPSRWDPGRYLPPRAEDQKAPQAYIGWGAGLHPCLGTRVAKLEIIVTTAMFMAYFDFELCEKDGTPRQRPLKPVGRNEHGTWPSREKVFMKLKTRV